MQEMQELSIIIIAVVAIDVWCSEFIVPFSLKEFKEGSFKGSLQYTLDRKPINCDKCLSFWIGLILSIVLTNPIYMGIYIINKLMR
jgi:hypothetical protein